MSEIEEEKIRKKIDDILAGTTFAIDDDEVETVETSEDITPAEDGGEEVEISEEEVKTKKPSKTAKKPTKDKTVSDLSETSKKEKPLTEKEKAWKERHAAWVEFEKAKKLMPEWIAFKRLKDEYIAKYGKE